MNKSCEPEFIRFTGYVKPTLHFSAMPGSDPRESSTFGERFSFGRWWQSLVTGDENDAIFGREVGRSSTVIGDYRKSRHTPNSGILSDAAHRMGVDYQWLTGKRSEPSAEWPDRELFLTLFVRWIETSRRQTAAHDEQSEGDSFESRTGLRKEPKSSPASQLAKSARKNVKKPPATKGDAAKKA